MSNKTLVIGGPELIGGKILSNSDLEKMNEEEVRQRNYKYCTIINGNGDTYNAKVEYSESSGAWEPTHVMMDGNWLSIDFFENSEEVYSYACENYRAVL